MTIETKYSIGEEVWVIENNSVLRGKVEKINICLSAYSEPDIQYVVSTSIGAVTRKNVIFASLDDLVESIKINAR